ncbi:bifunctional phosphoribosyl-AMP cyclohydrolase/phosphoribosyl-ATP diphosphatase HisIE [Gilliamella sp. wkB112]|uniref:bifunctional phosphoribosyl-AMP cyclohydrolase/phosphoribosyl-ATP diphosphatase HisIE n=1 Tax=Gilliamella sp. wkB112 TaxID=3120257 RepID=UPI00080E166D|nr:bifunctional phosphoribosyl-AMP cyclohydrolase/phosphoribosyl-ATP diphosphatase HisIE [Gilliamella apicola]OCG02957.1 bifunctional phosphoribosyl-AMP cyclohydrolase/phosphoribosyl-ATP diphosphatase [Gilliamella apicola]
MLNSNSVTTLNLSQLDWQKVNNLMPVIIQHYVSGDVLMLGYMNQDALCQTLDSGKVTFYSRTKQRLWTKGETSGNFLNVININADCDNDTLLILVDPIGPTCHKGTNSCFAAIKTEWGFLFELEQVIASRKSADPKSSYTAKLYHDGTKRIAQKVGEEGVETALAATVHDQEELKNESADLIYHLLVLLQDQNLSLQDVIGILKARHK